MKIFLNLFGGSVRETRKKIENWEKCMLRGQKEVNLQIFCIYRFSVYMLR